MCFYTMVRFLARALTSMFWVVDVSDLKNLPSDEGFVLCCNHLSMWDPIILLAKVEHKISFLGKIELFKFKFSAWFFKKAGVIPVNRGKGGTGVVLEAKKVIESGGVLGIFPEGTRAKQAKLLPAKSGAALIAIETGAVVFPVGVSYGSFRSWKNLWRREVCLQFGEAIRFDKQGFEGRASKELKTASKLIMSQISELVNY